MINQEVIFYVPNTFTPNGDEFNQTFKPIFSTGYDPYNYSMTIYNRWGEVVWESYDHSVGWDGSYNGELVQDGVYTWALIFMIRGSGESVNRTGHVTLVR